MKKKPARKTRKASTRQKKRDPRTTARLAVRAGWLSRSELGRASATAREQHLRGLMGLPETPLLEIDRERGE